MLQKYLAQILIGTGVFVLMISVIVIQSYRLGNAQEDRDEWKVLAEQHESALNLEKASKEAQIDALLKSSNREASRATTLIQQIKKVENSDEKIECSIPNMLIDAMRL